MPDGSPGSGDGPLSRGAALSLLATLSVTLSVCVACSGAVSRAAASGGEMLMLRSQIDGLNGLIARIEQGHLTRPDQLLAGLDEEPVSAAPGSLQVKLEVATVIAVSGRLWVMLDVVAGPWRSKGEEHSP